MPQAGEWQSAGPGRTGRRYRLGDLSSGMVAARSTHLSAGAAAVAIHAHHELADCKTGLAIVSENYTNIHTVQLAGTYGWGLKTGAELGSRTRSCFPMQNQDTSFHKE